MPLFGLKDSRAATAQPRANGRATQSRIASAQVIRLVPWVGAHSPPPRSLELPLFCFGRLGDWVSVGIRLSEQQGGQDVTAEIYPRPDDQQPPGEITILRQGSPDALALGGIGAFSSRIFVSIILLNQPTILPVDSVSIAYP